MVLSAGGYHTARVATLLSTDRPRLIEVQHGIELIRQHFRNLPTPKPMLRGADPKLNSEGLYDVMHGDHRLPYRPRGTRGPPQSQPATATMMEMAGVHHG